MTATEIICSKCGEIFITGIWPQSTCGKCSIHLNMNWTYKST